MFTLDSPIPQSLPSIDAPDLRRAQPQSLLRLGVVQLGVVQHRPDDLLHPRGAALGEGRDQDVVRAELE